MAQPKPAFYVAALLVIERAQRRGEVRVDIDPGFILLQIFLNVVLGSLFAEFIDPDGKQIFTPEVVIDTLLYGISARPAISASTPGA